MTASHDLLAFKNKTNQHQTKIEDPNLPLSRMSDEMVLATLRGLVTTERKITRQILELIIVIEDRKLYLQRWGSLFDFMTREMGYSEGAAQRRISAARMLRKVPAVASKIESGAVNLSTLSKAHSAFRVWTKSSASDAGRVPREESAREAAFQIVDAIEGLNFKQAERKLAELVPGSDVQKDHRQAVSSNITRWSMNLTLETEQKLERVRELLSHKYPEATLNDLIGEMADFYLQKKDPKRANAVKMDRTQSESTAEHPTTQRLADSAVNIAALRREVLRRGEGKCSICGSTYQVQIDHITPRALGGKDEIENLRLLCAKHNISESIRILGPTWAGAWK